MTRQEAIDDITKKALEMIDEQNYIEPACFLHRVKADGNNEIMLLPIPGEMLDTEDGKYQAVQMIRMVATKANAHMGLWISEAWVSTKPAGTTVNDDDFVPPSDDPDRTEAIVIIAADHAGTVITTIPFVRGQDDKVVEIQEAQSDETKDIDHEVFFGDTFRKKLH